MASSTELSREFLALLGCLAPGADVSAAVTWFHAHRQDCETALGEVPGVDQVRAGLVRLLPAVEPEEAARLPLVKAAGAALEAYAPEEGDAAHELRRAPAWVGLCAIEVGEALGEPPESSVAQALALAQRGFGTRGGLAQGDGEVLWAMAEAANGVGWSDRSLALLDAALTATFADDENAGRVALVHILERLEAGDEEVDEAVDALLARHDLDPQTRVHALWIGALRDRAAGQVGRAIQRLETARVLVDGDDEAEVSARIEEALTALGATSSPAEA